jgi:hypothetical protein
MCSQLAIVNHPHFFNNSSDVISQDPDERIYIIASYAPYARELLCEVRTPCIENFLPSPEVHALIII